MMQLDNATRIARAAVRDALENEYTRKSFATLDRHAARGPIDETAALRLLRRNARDALPTNPPRYLIDAVANGLLNAWRNRTVD